MWGRIQRGCVIYGRHFSVLAAAVLVFEVPLQVLEQVALPAPENPGGIAMVLQGVWTVYRFVLGLLPTAAVLLLLNARLQGEILSISEAYKMAFELWPHLVRAWIIPFIMICLGYVACVIPAIFLMVRFSFISYAVVLDDVRGDVPRERSFDYTKGVGWQLFGIMLLFGLIGGSIGIPAGMYTVNSSSIWIPYLWHFVGVIFSVVYLLQTCIVYVYYIDARMRFEAPVLPEVESDWPPEDAQP